MGGRGDRRNHARRRGLEFAAMRAAQFSQISAKARFNAILVRYVLFAIFAGLMNLLTQAIIFHMAPAPMIAGALDHLGLRINSFDFVLAISILAGTGVGLHNQIYPRQALDLF